MPSPSPTSVRETALRSDSPAGGQERILVCDDAPTLRALMAALLGRTYTVQLTATAEEALARAPEFAPDLVITDHILPGMSGRQLVARLRASPAFEDVPIILLTAVSDADARADGIEAGADEYLVKPVRERELLARVASLLRLRRTLLALSRRSRELEDANAALRDAQVRLVRSERLAALGSLAASLAHDINGPLSVVTSGAGAIRWLLARTADDADAAVSERAQRYLRELESVAGEVDAASRRLLEIGRDLRLFGSGSATAGGGTRLDDAVRTAVGLARARAQSPPTIELTGDGAPLVDAPPHLVTLALLSILDRAVLSAGPTGRVRVEVAMTGHGAEVSVRDDGPTIPLAVLPRVFDPFVRPHPAHAPTGLGLSVAAGIVQGLGGHVDVDPNVTEGACFRVTLPLTQGG